MPGYWTCNGIGPAQVSFAHDAKYDLSLMPCFCFWLKTSDANGYIANKHMSGSGWSIQVQNGCIWFTQSQAFEQVRVDDGKWHWYCINWEPPNYRIYVDNVLRQSKLWGVGPNLNSNLGLSFLLQESCSFDDFRMYSSAISPSMRLAIFNNGQGVTTIDRTVGTFNFGVNCDDFTMLFADGTAAAGSSGPGVLVVSGGAGTLPSLNALKPFGAPPADSWGW